MSKCRESKITLNKNTYHDGWTNPDHFAFKSLKIYSTGWQSLNTRWFQPSWISFLLKIIWILKHFSALHLPTATHESRRRLFQVSNLRSLTTKIAILLAKNAKYFEFHNENILQFFDLHSPYLSNSILKKYIFKKFDLEFVSFHSELYFWNFFKDHSWIVHDNIKLWKNTFWKHSAGRHHAALPSWRHFYPWKQPESGYFGQFLTF